MTFKRSEISLAAEQNVNANGGILWSPAAQADYLAEKLGGPAKGKAQMALIQKLRGYAMGGAKGHKFDFNDLVKGPEFRGIHYAKLMKAAEALAKKGRIAYDGKTITLTEDAVEVKVPKPQIAMQFLARGSRTGQMTDLAEAGPGYTPAQLLKFLKGGKPGTYTTVNELQYSFGGTASSHTVALKKLVKAGKLKVLPGKTMGRGSMYGLAEESARPGAALLREGSSPAGGPTGGFNRHQKLMSPDTRELVFKSREQEIEAFAADRGYDPRIVMAIAEVSMRMGRVPDLRQYGVYGEEALAIRHFVAGDILNLAIEDERPSASILSEALSAKDRQAIFNEVGAGDYVAPFKPTGTGKLWRIKDGHGREVKDGRDEVVRFMSSKAAGLFAKQLNKAGKREDVSSSASILSEARQQMVTLPEAGRKVEHWLKRVRTLPEGRGSIWDKASQVQRGIVQKKLMANLKLVGRAKHQIKVPSPGEKDITGLLRAVATTLRMMGSEMVKLTKTRHSPNSGVVAGQQFRAAYYNAVAETADAAAVHADAVIAQLPSPKEAAKRRKATGELLAKLIGRKPASEDEWLSASILSEAKKLGKWPKKWEAKAGKKEIELGIRLAKQGLIGSKDPKEIRWAQKLYAFAYDAKGSGVAWWEKAEEAEKVLKAWLKKHGHPVPKTVNHAWVIEDAVPSASILSEAVYNLSARPAASVAGTDVSKMADQIAKAIAPFLKGRYQTVQAQDVYGQAQSIHIRSGNITPEMIRHNVAWHNDPYKFQAIVSGFNKDGSAGPKISVEQLSGSYKTKKMRKKTVKPGKESLMVNHIKKYVAGMMKDAPAPRAEDVSVSILRGAGIDPQLDEMLGVARMKIDSMIRKWIKKHGTAKLDKLRAAIKKAFPDVEDEGITKRLAITGGIVVKAEAEELTEATGKAKIKGKVTFMQAGGVVPTIVMELDGIHLAAPRGWLLDPVFDNWKELVAKHKSLKTVKKGKSKTINMTVEFYKSPGDYKIRVYVGDVLLSGFYIDPAFDLWKKLVAKYPRLSAVTEAEDVGAARALPEFTDLLGSEKLKALHEVAPPGFSGTVKAMKGEGGTKKAAYKDEPGSPDEPKDIDNPWALAWHMYGKGDKPHFKPEKGKTRYKSPEKYAADKKKAEEADGNLRAATRFAELLGCRLAQTQAPSKYTL